MLAEEQSSDIPLTLADTTPELPARPINLELLDTKAMAINEVTAGGINQMENESPTNTSIEHKKVTNMESSKKAEIDALGTEELRNSGAINLKDMTGPYDKDEMDADISEGEQDKAKEEDVEEVEDTASASWILPSIKDDGNEPKLSLKQLLIMALVTSPSRSMSMEEIYQWINDGFLYYKDQTFQHTLNPSSYNWMEELNDILHRYDFPTEPVENLDVENKNVLFHLPPGREWHILPKPNKMKAKPFRFMDLPYDIRLMIVELALQRPLPQNHGWIIDPDYTAKRKENYRKTNRLPQRLTAVGPHCWELRTDGLDKVLALLSVSKQVYAEAAPVFYRTNFFEFDSAATLSRFFDGIPFRRKVCD
jgi:Forkhead domain